MLDLSGKVKKTESHYFAFGGFADIWKGEWDDDEAGQRVQVSQIWFRLPFLIPSIGSSEAHQGYLVGHRILEQAVPGASALLFLCR
jgi:hypothetical protein